MFLRTLNTMELVISRTKLSTMLKIGLFRRGKIEIHGTYALIFDRFEFTSDALEIKCLSDKWREFLKLPNPRFADMYSNQDQRSLLSPPTKSAKRIIQLWLKWAAWNCKPFDFEQSYCNGRSPANILRISNVSWKSWDSPRIRNWYFWELKLSFESIFAISIHISIEQLFL